MNWYAAQKYLAHAVFSGDYLRQQMVTHTR